ncbi:aminotransferase class I/II-fold pyridoxal phosphate-dependent enzyme [Jiella sp. MQZ9-1]|uniref:aspartate transaminase n=1 Tax=Jiella flava TaxID=2816857 RepID=A0A939G0U5_9HYPH|nr:aminotransferase class I/II-fold pyridoxal phosphate-dependent enzyme [Jiella flava]MBO0663731.1 aminotransferase class I/II-fold pyridoxal phosphate-dependent enzyme [Jiella flava]MCD2472303.1 aminotransferase class I/II-fold pyridoxal phosphate-dependent enzyme [Jiella flava]
MTVNLASQRSDVLPFRAMEVLAEANTLKARGAPVISLAVGQPDAPTPAAAIAAANAHLQRGRIAYTDAPGLPSLRERIARHYAEAYGVAVDPSRILITTGSSGGFNLAFLAAFDPGARIALASPGYPAYRNVLRVLGLEPVEIPVSADTNYLLTADHLEAAHRERPIDGVLVASPANPTGTVTPPAELKRLIEFADAHHIRFISDEIYHRLAYSGGDATALAFSDRPVIVNSFSKYYCMTGWRIGWMVLPTDMVRVTERIAQSLYISAPELSQVAAEAVFEASDELDAVRAGYIRNRDLLMQALPDLGFRDIAPIDGAFYAYAGLPDDETSASILSRRLLARCHVAITPGVDFDLARGEHFIRLSYACSHAALAEALERMRAELQG